MKPHPSHDFTSRRCTYCREDVLSLEARYRCRPIAAPPVETEQPELLDFTAEDMDAIAGSLLDYN